MSQTNTASDGGVSRAVGTDRFREKITEQYPEAGDLREAIERAVLDVWPVVTDGDRVRARRDIDESEIGMKAARPDAMPDGDYTWYPCFRKHQQDAVVDIVANLYVSDNDVVTLSAPTGAGKSLILHGAMAVMDEVFNRDSFFTTPLNALIDQVDEDEFISEDIITMKGKNNYSCVHPEDSGTSVDKAICQRDADFDCRYKDMFHTNGGCPYYGRKHAAKKNPEVVTNMSYLMANSMLPEMVDSKFMPRELLVVDECQSIEDFALSFVGFVVSSRQVPVVYDDISEPPQTEDIDRLTEWLREEVLYKVTEKLHEYEMSVILNEKEADDRDKLREFARRVDNFLVDVEDHHWVAELEDDPYGDDDEWKVSFNPIFIGRFLDDYLWSQGQKIILSSATIPKSGFLEEIGLDSADVGAVEVESTFPPGRRPVYTDQSVGKMTMSQRDRTIPKMASKIADLSRHHDDEKGFVHCHSYKIASRIYKRLPRDVKARARVQDSSDRERSLEEWVVADIDEENAYDEEEGGQIFLSVAMDEGISLDDEKARWQVIAKAAYPFMGDKRVSYRMDELNDWNWYAGKAAINLQQAVGRGMRSKDDWCHTYVLDKSAVDLIDRNKHLFEDWFLNAVDVEPDVAEERV